MSRLLRLRTAARDEVHARAQAILDGAAEEDGRELTDAEEAELVELRSDIERLDQQIADLEAWERSEPTPEPPPPPPSRPSLDQQVQVRSEPGVYGDGAAGMRRFLTDLGVVSGVHDSLRSEHARSRAQERMDRHRDDAQSDRATPYARAVALADIGGVVGPHVIHERATSMGDLVGIVHEQFDPAMTRRGIYPAAVTTRLANRYPIFAEGDKLTLPRVTTQPTAAVQAEGANFNDAKVVTAGVTADLITVGARAEISIQAVERGNISVELLSDELQRAWMQTLNQLVLIGQGSSATPDEPLGLLQKTGRTGQFIEKNDASPTVAKAVDFMTAAKTAVSKANLMRPDCLIVSPGFIGAIEEAKTTGGEYLVPPWPAWAFGSGGAGVAPMMEGVTSELEWRRIPVYSDSQISDSWKADDSGNGAGGDETRIIAMTGTQMPIFYNGPMTYSYEQTLAASGQVLLVVRGYAAFNPMWAPESWRVVHGTGLKLGL